MTIKREITYDTESSDEGFESKFDYEESRTQNQRPNHRHTPYQIKRLEEVFTHCPRPSQKVRIGLGEEIGLAPLQVKFWFQNKRTQTKGKQNNKENNELRAANDQLREENDALKSGVRCFGCSCPLFDSGEAERLNQLRAENARLHEELVRVSEILARFVGRPVPDCSGSSSSSRDGN